MLVGSVVLLKSRSEKVWKRAQNQRSTICWACSNLFLYSSSSPVTEQLNWDLHAGLADSPGDQGFYTLFLLSAVEETSVGKTGRLCKLENAPDQVGTTQYSVLAMATLD